MSDDSTTFTPSDSEGDSQPGSDRGAAHRRMFAELAFEHGPVGLVITDANHRVLTANPTFTTITGYNNQGVVGWDIERFHSQDQQPEYQRIRQALAESGYWQGEVHCHRKNGERYPELLAIEAIHDTQGQVTHYVRAFLDITSIKQTESQLRQKAHYDPLTGLANRLLLRDRLEHAIRHAERQEHALALLFLDLDGFKRINDSLGHAAGDQLLIQAARRLGRLLREQDTLARFGGDEFIILIERDVSEASAQAVALRLQEALEPPFWIAGQHLPVSASIGIALYPKDSIEADDLIRQADSAMYAAKRAGHGQYAFVDKALGRDLQRQLKREMALHEAIHMPDRHFRLVYQPQVDLTSGKVVGLEALVRWHQPGHPPALPNEFLPLAHSLGLAVRLDRWVIHQAIAQHESWVASDSPLAALPIAVNIVDQHLLESAFDNVPLDQYLRSQVGDASWLTLEVASDTLACEPEETQHLLRRLKRLGVTLSIDELGEGRINFAYLSRLPFTQAKFSGSLVSTLAKHKRSRLLLSGIAQMLDSLGVHGLAVGVENQATADALVSEGITRAQGNHLARPMSVDELAEWFAQANQET
ncbi:putative bifunctional diguanylate cyclase/phosphodiesterase [Litchfieldella xinjiangensis]|uniref:putative bifunctional diguanylate cyclase/phosphodiesterase n=1 Tax=Litchfieldella xinjiangensis TaxID=1166948 RepID=UPI0009DD3029|nr:EAL domain-containing protein [Halomonas xinjiangensis]